MAEMNRSFSGSMPELYDRLLVPLQFEPFAQDLAERLRAVRSGGQFLFNVWGDKTGTARLLAEQVVGQKLSRDPASLVAPEYNDIETVSADLATAGFTSVSAVKVSKKTFSASAREAAIANC